MIALLHYSRPGTPAVGVWWLPKHGTVPKGVYRDWEYYTDGALAVFGENWNGVDTFSEAQWYNRCVSLANSANPFNSWVFDEVGDAEQFLAEN